MNTGRQRLKFRGLLRGPQSARRGKSHGGRPSASEPALAARRGKAHATPGRCSSLVLLRTGLVGVEDEHQAKAG
jgi:hypothetical protein